jgi:hypothetical protein
MLPLFFTTYVFGVHVLNEDWDNVLATFMYAIFLLHIPYWLQYVMVLPIMFLYVVGSFGEAIMVNGPTFDLGHIPAATG